MHGREIGLIEKREGGSKARERAEKQRIKGSCRVVFMMWVGKLTSVRARRGDHLCYASQRSTNASHIYRRVGMQHIAGKCEPLARLCRLAITRCLGTAAVWLWVILVLLSLHMKAALLGIVNVEWKWLGD